MSTALVTGATAGIGRAFAERLAADRYDVVLVARDEARLRAVAHDLRGRHAVDCEVLPADLLDPAQLRTVEARLRDPDRPVDFLVNNAGFGQRKPFWATSIDEEEAQLDLLVRVVLRLTHAAVRAMLERGEGSVVNVSSVAGFTQRGTYSAHKAWVTNFSQSLAARLPDRRVRVMALCPGFVHTEFHQRMGMDKSVVPTWMWLNAEDVVAAAMADLAKGKPVSIPSVRYKALIGAARYVPRSIVTRVSSLGLAGGRRRR